jgi:hypothetical protein
VPDDDEDPKGTGGAWRDDQPDNVQVAHWCCNGEKGSTSINAGSDEIPCADNKLWDKVFYGVG